MIFQGKTKQLHNIFKELNEIHPTLKFTIEHTTPDLEHKEHSCDCEKITSIPFLDTSCSLEKGFIDTDRNYKPTDRNQYLLPESCHPNGTTRSIPFTLSLRISRISRKPYKRLKELKQLLMDRGYSENIVDPVITKALSVPRKRAILKQKNNKTTRRSVFGVKYKRPKDSSHTRHPS